MTNINLQCQNCHKIFFSGIAMLPGSSATFINNKSRCPYCGSFESIPNGTFGATVDGLVGILQKSEDPLREAEELLKAVKKLKNEVDLLNLKQSTSFKKYSAWLPNNLQNIAAYATIIGAIIGVLMLFKSSQSKSPEMNLETIVNQQYNQIIKIYNSNIDQT